MGQLFQKYLPKGCKFVDVGCGAGDALIIASHYQGGSELWGLDINPACIEVARVRMSTASLVCGDMQNPATIPQNYFDVVHEFGASFLASRWDLVAKAYFSLLKEGGILLWELPRKWSPAHISYLFTVAPKNTAADTKLKRVFRSFLPWKYKFRSDATLRQALAFTGCEYELLETVVIWHFFCPKAVRWFLDKLWVLTGDGLFDLLDSVMRVVWRRESGYYLVIKKLGA